MGAADDGYCVLPWVTGPQGRGPWGADYDLLRCGRKTEGRVGKILQVSRL